jgi:hypothetical protein
MSHPTGKLATGHKRTRSEGTANHSTGDLNGPGRQCPPARYGGKEFARGSKGRRPLGPNKADGKVVTEQNCLQVSMKSSIWRRSGNTAHRARGNAGEQTGGALANPQFPIKGHPLESLFMAAIKQARADVFAGGREMGVSVMIMKWGLLSTLRQQVCCGG